MVFYEELDMDGGVFLLSSRNSQLYHIVSLSVLLFHSFNFLASYVDYTHVLLGIILKDINTWFI